MKNGFASTAKKWREHKYARGQEEKEMKLFDSFTIDIVDELMLVVVLSIYLQ